MRTLCLLQARMSSSRLPGKVLRPIIGRPMIELEVERIQRAKTLDSIMVATSTDPSDDAIVEWARSRSLGVSRGNLTDVLDRFVHAAIPLNPEHVVRLTADCPLIDPALIDRAVEHHLESGVDYTSTREVLDNGTMRHTFPHGTDVEVVRFEALRQAWKDSVLPSEREHVTMHLYRHPERFSLEFLHSAADRGGERWTVDYPEDLEFVSEVYGSLYASNPAFTTEDVFSLLQAHPELRQINANLDGNEGLRRSAAQDAEAIVKQGGGR